MLSPVRQYADYLIHQVAQKEQGFTLLELSLVVSLLVVLSSFGFIFLRDYTASKTVSEVAKNFLSDVTLARSRAQSQVKPTTGDCASFPLDGYSVELTGCTQGTCTGYSVAAVCNAKPSTVIKQETFPTEVTVSSELSSLLFQSLTGTVKGAVPGKGIGFTRNGTTILIQVYEDGRIVNTSEQ